MDAIDRLFLAAYNAITPQVMIALSLMASASLLNSFYWFAHRGRIVQRPAGLLAIAGAFAGTAVFYIVLAVEPLPALDITRGASRILWTTLCLSTLHNNSGSVALTIREWRRKRSRK